jgi:hypothetical protein
MNMTISEYHQKYANLPDEEIAKRAKVRELELVEISKHVILMTGDRRADVGVIGCGDKRFIKLHQKMFEDVLNKPVRIISFDISVEHLKGEKNVIMHDCVKPLPNGPYDLIYAHVVLKFNSRDKQWQILKNSYDALQLGGIAIHIINKEDYSVREEKLASGYFSVPVKLWKEQLSREGIKFIELPLGNCGIDFEGIALVLMK